ncbi:FixH family protein [Chitinilyticum litopenaei]|uniref:FixH family protein n=1 Tax=Chitinilyticum litopenaei TaxID=1121276 RepID=UPI000414639C|nr:FixH family protein [Chitinilyticum litopenaei]
MEHTSAPWYKHSFVWLLILLPLTAVLASILLIYQAVSTSDGLVDDDYYKSGREINKQFDRDRAAAALGLQAQLVLSEDGKTLRILLGKPVAGPLLLKLMHPTQAGRDHVLALKALSPQLWEARLDQALATQRWKVELGDEQRHWRLQGSWRMDREESIILQSTTR